VSPPELREGSEDVSVGLIKFIVRISSEGGDSFNLIVISFSSGAWGNQFDLELFYLLNSGWESLAPNLETGEARTAIPHIDIKLPAVNFLPLLRRKLGLEQYKGGCGQKVGPNHNERIVQPVKPKQRLKSKGLRQPRDCLMRS